MASTSEAFSSWQSDRYLSSYSQISDYIPAIESRTELLLSRTKVSPIQLLFSDYSAYLLTDFCDFSTLTDFDEILKAEGSLVCPRRLLSPFIEAALKNSARIFVEEQGENKKARVVIAGEDFLTVVVGGDAAGLEDYVALQAMMKLNPFVFMMLVFKELKCKEEIRIASKKGGKVADVGLSEGREVRKLTEEKPRKETNRIESKKEDKVLKNREVERSKIKDSQIDASILDTSMLMRLPQQCTDEEAMLRFEWIESKSSRLCASFPPQQLLPTDSELQALFLSTKDLLSTLETPEFLPKKRLQATHTLRGDSADLIVRVERGSLYKLKARVLQRELSDNQLLGQKIAALMFFKEYYPIFFGFLKIQLVPGEVYTRQIDRVVEDIRRTDTKSQDGILASNNLSFDQRIRHYEALADGCRDDWKDKSILSFEKGLTGKFMKKSSASLLINSIESGGESMFLDSEKGERIQEMILPEKKTNKTIGAVKKEGAERPKGPSEKIEKLQNQMKKEKTIISEAPVRKLKGEKLISCVEKENFDLEILDSKEISEKAKGLRVRDLPPIQAFKELCKSIKLSMRISTIEGGIRVEFSLDFGSKNESDEVKLAVELETKIVGLAIDLGIVRLLDEMAKIGKQGG